MTLKLKCDVCGGPFGDFSIALFDNQKIIEEYCSRACASQHFPDLKVHPSVNHVSVPDEP